MAGFVAERSRASLDINDSKFIMTQKRTRGVTPRKNESYWLIRPLASNNTIHTYTNYTA